MHDQPCYTYRSALGGQTRGPGQKARVSDLQVSLRLGPWEKPTGQYWSSTGAVGQGWRLNKADVLCVSRRVDATPPPPPPDAMHFHSGAGCCTVQSGPGAEVNRFTSSAAETKEQWERRSEHRERTYYQPRGTLLTDTRESLELFLSLFSFWGGLYMQSSMHVQKNETTPSNSKGWYCCRQTLSKT